MCVNTSVFEQFAPYTNVAELMQYSAMPLRKCVRVNTLRMSVADFIEYAKVKHWQLESVPWCAEGFFIDRTDYAIALGKDLLHQLGYFYIQEASSMLPPVLLDPKPGELVLDMSAAPGSKTTQMAAMMHNKGLIIANDVQPKRLKTLQSACYRLGALNTLLMQKNGQWYGSHMTERFDKVLCDAPCSALGTIRKDHDAISLSTDSSVEHLANIQKALLVSACMAVKPEGFVVYSTCTLTVEENEAIIAYIFEKFPNVFELREPDFSWAKKAVEESVIVQNATSTVLGPMLRLWPQTYNTEGFFSAVLYKKQSIVPYKKGDALHRRERPLSASEVRKVTSDILEQFGTNFLRPNESLSEWEGILYASTTYAQDLPLPNRNYSLGVPYAKLLRNNRARLLNTIAVIRGQESQKNVVHIQQDEANALLSGENISCASNLNGDVVLLYNTHCLGIGVAHDGMMKNTIDRELIQANVVV